MLAVFIRRKVIIRTFEIVKLSNCLNCKTAVVNNLVNFLTSVSRKLYSSKYVKGLRNIVKKEYLNISWLVDFVFLNA